MLIGTPMSGSQADDWDDEKWQAFVKRYQDAYPESERYSSPSLYATNYYNATVAALTALEDQRRSRRRSGQFPRRARQGRTRRSERPHHTRREPPGNRLDLHHRGHEGEDGNLYNKFVSKADNVNQTLGMSPEEFRAIGLPGRDTPECSAN
jgi:branched-chain amino acid transport system substrate-binding protein